jgi:hypothetical protein
VVPLRQVSAMVNVSRDVRVAEPRKTSLNVMPTYMRNLPKLSSRTPVTNMSVAKTNESAREAAAALVASFRSMRK